ncbi:hypothetical protein [Hymenobacter baengnokdamensis]|uniref:hypothetical protein n=1 Tax=Hymenobacter baengnokdamensis TaxID=2615203 RepID=UPI0012474B6A|nr:hypothetical protein [Hymenobacter baengnokdamensis]
MNQALLDDLQEIADRVPEIDSERQYWFIRTNRGKFYDDFYYNNCVGIGYNLVSLPQVAKALSHDTNPYGELVKVILEKYPDDFDNKNIGKPAGLFYRFFEDMKAGDVVVMPSFGSSKYAFGVVTEGKPFEADSSSFDDEEIYRKRRPVEWIVQKEFAELDSKLYQAFRAPQALSTLKPYASFIDREMYAIYVKDGKTHFRLDIEALGSVNGNDYFPMGNILLTLTEEFREQAGIDESFSEVIVRQNVQSRGLLEFITKNKMMGIFLVCATWVGLEGGDYGVNKIGLTFHPKGLIPEMLQFYQEYHKQQNINAVLSGKLAGVDAKLTPDVLRILEGQSPAPTDTSALAPAAAVSADSAITAASSAKAATAATASLAKAADPATLDESAAKISTPLNPTPKKP